MQKIPWDRTHQWILRRSIDEVSDVAVLFGSGFPSAIELVRVRRLVPKLRSVSPSDIASKVEASGEFFVGTMARSEAEWLIEEANRMGVDIACKHRDVASYLPYDVTTGMALVIERDDESLQVAEEMMAAGVEVFDI